MRLAPSGRLVAISITANGPTPLHADVWLNQVEIWFSKLERDVIARGIFTSVQDLARKLMRYVRAYSKSPSNGSTQMSAAESCHANELTETVN